jgi:hypothetical protein
MTRLRFRITGWPFGPDGAALKVGLPGWPGALFPAKPPPFNGASPSASVSDPRAEELQAG